MAVLKRWFSFTLTVTTGHVACTTGGDVFFAPPGARTEERSEGTSEAISEATSGERTLSTRGDADSSERAGSRREASTSDSESTSSGRPSLTPVVGMTVASDHGCAVRAGRTYCFGANTWGQLGVSTSDPSLWAEPIDSEVTADLVVAGYGYTCLRLTDGEVGCFGRNDHGQLGSADHTSRHELRRVALPSTVKAISTKFGTVCVVLDAKTNVAEGTVYCWGANENNQCGTGTFEADDDEPTPVRPILDVAARDVAVGRGHTCILTEGDELWCWGSNGSHELGLGPDAPGLTVEPNRVSELYFAQVAAGQNHTCAITIDGYLYCWGDMLENDGHSGPMGHDDRAAHAVPARVGQEADWTMIATDTFHSCGLRGDGQLWCWGRNAEGQLGVGHFDVVNERVHVSSSERFTQVAVGRFHTCALRDDGVVVCAGKNENGELASGDTTRRNTLTPIQ